MHMPRKQSLVHFAYKSFSLFSLPLALTSHQSFYCHKGGVSSSSSSYRNPFQSKESFGHTSSILNSQTMATASNRLEGKIALITGGATGLGESITRLFRSHGAKVCVADIQDDLGQNVCESLGGESYACFIHCNVTVEDDIQHAVDFTVEKFGTVDIIVNNAGITGNKVTDIRNVDFDEFKKVFDVNVNGAFLGMKHAARVMIPKGKGSIISIASVASVIGGLGPHGYTGSKHAVVGLTKNVAAELGKHGIRVNCVSPYAVPTSLSMPHLPEDEKEEDALKGFLSFAGRNANLKGVDLMPKDVADAVLFLASDEAKYISAHNLMIDGGFTSVNNSLKPFE